MIALALLLAQSEGKPWEKYQAAPVERPAPERLGAGPHTLVISDGAAMTRTEYKTGPQCQRARDSVRRQVAPPADTQYRIYGPAKVSAFCVPR